MNDNNRKLKALGLSLGLVLGMTTPKIGQAQFVGGLFGYGREVELQHREGMINAVTGLGYYNLYNQQFGDDHYGGYNLNNQTFGQEVPLGNGLLVLTAAGLGYALKKKKQQR